MNIRSSTSMALASTVLVTGVLSAQDLEPLEGAVIYDYDPASRLGDHVYGTVICDFANDDPGRNSHGAPVCMEYANGDLVAFHSNTSGHNIDGWSEYAVSKDKGRTWQRNNKFQYSHAAWLKDQTRPAWVEEGLVTEDGTVVLFVTHFEDGRRNRSGVIRSFDHGSTWTDYLPVDGSFVGYPTAVAVVGAVSYALFDQVGSGDRHVLYASADSGRSWQRRSMLPLEQEKSYGALCVMTDEQRPAAVDKRIRDPELACIGGRYYLHGRAGHGGPDAHRFVLYQSDDGEHWDPGIIVSGCSRGPDGYSHNCIINRYDDDLPCELMVVYSVIYAAKNTNEHVFFIRPEGD